MSTIRALIPNRDREIELIQKILDRTIRRKLLWRRRQSAVTAGTPNGMRFDFILAAPFPGSLVNWVTFTVRDMNTTVLQVQRGLVPATAIPGLSIDPLVSAVNGLFEVVAGTANDEIGQALKKLDEF